MTVIDSLYFSFGNKYIHDDWIDGATYIYFNKEKLAINKDEFTHKTRHKSNESTFRGVKNDNVVIEYPQNWILSRKCGPSCSEDCLSDKTFHNRCECVSGNIWISDYKLWIDTVILVSVDSNAYDFGVERVLSGSLNV